MMIEIYTRASCPYCIMAKDLLRQKGMTFKETEISGNEGLRNEMIRRSSRHTVPQIFFNGEPFGGYDDIATLDTKGELDKVLRTENCARSTCS